MQDSNIYKYYMQINIDKQGEKENYLISIGNVEEYTIGDLKELFGESLSSANFLGVVEFENHNTRNGSSKNYKKEIYNVPLFNDNELDNEEEDLRVHIIDNVMDRIRTQRESKKELVNISHDMYRELYRQYNEYTKDSPGTILC